ncbi:unnamed protein product [Citrullus colocynthis]|uniref:Pectinesterase inhibitor domain-containing protein n=1 Tax=Citrullus colocynthis TaxID=252529 RepID=A0ABP0XNS1_9ROSI
MEVNAKLLCCSTFRPFTSLLQCHDVHACSFLKRRRFHHLPNLLKSAAKATESSLASKTADPKLEEWYASCAEHYDDAAGDIDDAKIYLAEGDYNGVNIQASGAMTEVDDCQDNFTRPLVDRTTVSRNAKALEDICSLRPFSYTFS